MSELKAMTSGEIRTRDALLGYWWYEKSEADKVIAEKDAEIARLKDIRKVHVEAIESMGAGLLQDYDEIRHQKYKRCLAMAKICENKLGTVVKPGWWDKWRRRWLELAEQFKDKENQKNA